MNKTMFGRLTGMQRTQINNFCKNKVTRFDADVLARICYALDCQISDLLVYVPDERQENKD